jgi:hypothetical protein
MVNFPVKGRKWVLDIKVIMFIHPFNELSLFRSFPICPSKRFQTRLAFFSPSIYSLGCSLHARNEDPYTRSTSKSVASQLFTCFHFVYLLQ